MPEANPPTPPQRAPRGTKKHPMDFTGKQNEQLQSQHADEIAEAAEQMSMIQVVRPKRSGKVHDYTAENRPKQRTPVVEEPVGPPKKYQIRILADIDDMTFGREVISDAVFDDQGFVTQAPVVGPLWTMSFTEGEEYIVDEPVYQHLVRLGYVFGAE